MYFWSVEKHTHHELVWISLTERILYPLHAEAIYQKHAKQEFMFIHLKKILLHGNPSDF